MPDFVLDQESDGFAHIKVVGVGGGGCNAVDSMFDIGLQNVEFYVINSDLQALKRSKCPNRIQIGAELTRGRGCGAAPELGEQCMNDAREEVMETLQGADVVFVTAGLGGGTGTGAAPVVAQIARELGILTVAVVTRPFKFEGTRRAKSAEGGLGKLRECCDTMIVVNNDRLLDVVGPKVPMKEAFRVADEVLAQAVTSISDLVASPGLINVDFEDIRTIMGGRGGAVMGVGVGKGENRSQESVKKATSSPLLDKIVIDGATGVLICVTGGPDMTLQEASEAAELVSEAVDPDADVIFGAVIDESLTDTMRVTLIATGFNDEIQRKEFAAAKPKEQPQAAPVRNGFHSQKRPVQPAVQEPVEDELDSNPVFQEAAPAEEPQPRRQPQFQQPEPQHYYSEPQSQPKPKPEPKHQTDPAPSGNGGNGGQSNSLRATLERMMNEKGQSGQPPIRVAKSKPGNGGGHPAVRPQESRAEPEPEQETNGHSAPNVSLFDPEKEQQSEENDAEFDKPAFLRRRRSLFE